MKNNRITVFILIVIIVFVATFGFAVGVVSVPTIYSYADDETVQFFPYMDQMQDSTAAIYVYMKKYGFTFEQLSDNALNVPSAIISNSLMAYSKATGTDYAQNVNTIKNGTGLLNDGSGNYYFSPQAQDLLSKFTNYFAEENGIDVNLPMRSAIYDHGFLVGSDNERYSLFYYRSEFDFDWGSCAPLGSLVPDQYKSASGTFSAITPWGSESCTSNINNYGIGSVKMSSFGSASFSTLYSTNWKSGGLVEEALASPCLVINSIGSARRYVYKGSVRYNPYTQKYSLYYGSNNIYQTIESNVPKSQLNFDYDGSDLPDPDPDPDPDNPDAPLYQPMIINLGDSFNTYNSNTYTEINNNPQNITIVNPSDPDDPDPDDPIIPYNPYPDNPNYDPQNPLGPGGTTTDPYNTGGGSGEDDTDITFPDFDFQLPEINWSLGDLSEKFPFSIPFDLVAFFTVMNAEPEAPAIDAEIPLGDWYTWNFQADFSQFDRYAAIIRNVEFIAFCIGLIYLTIKLVRG